MNIVNFHITNKCWPLTSDFFSFFALAFVLVVDLSHMLCIERLDDFNKWDDLWMGDSCSYIQSIITTI